MENQNLDLQKFAEREALKKFKADEVGFIITKSNILKGAESEQAKEYWLNYFKNNTNDEKLYTEEQVFKMVWQANEIYSEFKDTPRKYLKQNISNWFNKIKKSF